MNAQIITIGDELLIGQTLNTNAKEIGAALSDAQINVSKISTVGDDEKAILLEFTDAFKRNDIIITTGGLGPTHDDITRSAVTTFFKTTLIQDSAVLSDIIERFSRLNRHMAKVNEEQALVPSVATAIRNKLGTAPGFWIQRDGRIFVCMPGVPHEMSAMLEGTVIPRLKEITRHMKRTIRKRTLLTTGIPESTLSERLGNLNELLGDAKLAFLPSPAGVKLRITVTAETSEEADDQLLQVEQKIRAIAGRYIYGKDDEQLAAVVGRLLKERSLTVSFAESCTGGFVSHLITNIGGSSEYFERGVVSYSNASKVELLKVDEEAIAKFGAVSYEVARQMAAGIRAISATDIGISLTGILGPTGGSTEKPVGTIFIGYCDDRVCTALKLQLGDNRIINKERAAQAALALLRRMLLGIPVDE